MSPVNTAGPLTENGDAVTLQGFDVSANTPTEGDYLRYLSDQWIGSPLTIDVLEYKGAWNATTNSPTLADAVGNTGDMYRVSVGGTQNLGSGNITFAAGDYAVYNGTTWEKIDTSDLVTSVAGKTGAVTLVPADTGLGNVTNDAQIKLADLDVSSTFGSSDTKVKSEKAIRDFVNAKLVAAGGNIVAVKSSLQSSNSTKTATALADIPNIGSISLDVVTGDVVEVFLKGRVTSDASANGVSFYIDVDGSSGTARVDYETVNSAAQAGLPVVGERLVVAASDGTMVIKARWSADNVNSVTLPVSTPMVLVAKQYRSVAT